MKRQSSTEIFEIKAEENHFFRSLFDLFLKLQGIATAHSVHWSITSPLPSKTPSPFSCQAPLLKSANCPTPSPLGSSPLYIGFS